MLSQKLEKKRPEILRKGTIQKIDLDQFRAEFDAIDFNFFVDAFPGIIHQKFVQNYGSCNLNMDAESIQSNSFDFGVLEC